MVHGEKLTTGINLSQAEDVEEYRDAFRRLRDAAVPDDEAAGFLRALIAELGS